MIKEIQALSIDFRFCKLLSLSVKVAFFKLEIMVRHVMVRSFCKISLLCSYFFNRYHPKQGSKDTKIQANNDVEGLKSQTK